MTARPASTFAAAIACAAILLVAGTRVGGTGGSGKAYFESGVRQYNLGHFKEAIVEFEKAYNIDPAPISAVQHRAVPSPAGRQGARAVLLPALSRAGARGREQARGRAAHEGPDGVAAAGKGPEAEAAARCRDDRAQPHGAGVTPPPPPPPPPPNPDKYHQAPYQTGQLRRRWLAEAFLAPSFIAFSGREVDAPALFALRLGGSYGLPRGGVHPSGGRRGAGRGCPTRIPSPRRRRIRRCGVSCSPRATCSGRRRR